MKQIDAIKYQLYEASVIDPVEDIRIFRDIFMKQTNRIPRLYREDFCGTFAHSAAWVKQSEHNCAWALDLDHKPLRFGFEKHYLQLTVAEQRRLTILRRDVLKGCGQKVDLITATNFSYYLFKDRRALQKYFECVRRALKTNGLFLMDAVGGQQMMIPNIERKQFSKTKELPAFTYFWEQKGFNIVNHEAEFAIHFELKNPRRTLKNAFRYDWRIWSLAELRETLRDAGFKSVDVYFEGSTRSGLGNGVFSRKDREPSCDVWIAYIAARS